MGERVRAALTGCYPSAQGLWKEVVEELKLEGRWPVSPFIPQILTLAGYMHLPDFTPWGN